MPQKKEKQTKDWKQNITMSPTEPSGSTLPALCTQRCLLCHWWVGDAAGEKQTEWEMNATWQNTAMAMALICKASLLHEGSYG